MKGIIKKLDERGFGFITPEGESKDVFFHRNDLSGVSFNDLHEGDKVTFEKQDAEKGPKAVNITLMEEGDSDDETAEVEETEAEETEEESTEETEEEEV